METFQILPKLASPNTSYPKHSRRCWRWWGLAVKDASASKIKARMELAF
jgi:hypothetical protein